MQTHPSRIADLRSTENYSGFAASNARIITHTQKPHTNIEVLDSFFVLPTIWFSFPVSPAALPKYCHSAYSYYQYFHQPHATVVTATCLSLKEALFEFLVVGIARPECNSQIGRGTRRMAAGAESSSLLISNNTGRKSKKTDVLSSDRMSSENVYDEDLLTTWLLCPGIPAVEQLLFAEAVAHPGWCLIFLPRRGEEFRASLSRGENVRFHSL